MTGEIFCAIVQDVEDEHTAFMFDDEGVVVKAWGTRLKFSTAFHPQTDGRSRGPIQNLEDHFEGFCALDGHVAGMNSLCYGGITDRRDMADKQRRDLEFQLRSCISESFAIHEGVKTFCESRAKLSPRFIGPLRLRNGIPLSSFIRILSFDQIQPICLCSEKPESISGFDQCSFGQEGVIVIFRGVSLILLCFGIRGVWMHPRFVLYSMDYDIMIFGYLVTDDWVQSTSFTTDFGAHDSMVSKLGAGLAVGLRTLIVDDLRNGAESSGGSGGGGDATPQGIHVWIERFTKLKPLAFRSAVTPAEAEDWITHMEKLFQVLGCPENFKTRLAAFKLEGDALSWWKAHLRTQVGGDAFADTCTWVAFREIFYNRYFPASEQQRYEREYGSICQLDRENSGDAQRQARHFKWGLKKWVLDRIVNTDYTNVAQVAPAARNIELLHESGNSNKRDRDGNRIQNRGQGQQENKGRYDQGQHEYRGRQDQSVEHRGRQDWGYDSKRQDF
ncbi:zinc finger, CCHC-type, retrotransposon gag domain protein [Tanacetum coccineum]